MLRAILNKSGRQHPTKQQLYGHLPPITKTIKVRRTRHAGHGWRSKDDLISNILLCAPSHGRAKAGRPARTYIQDIAWKTSQERWTIETAGGEGQGDLCWQCDMMMMISPKVNVIMRLEFELAHYDFAVKYVSHYATVILSSISSNYIISIICKQF